MSDENIKRLREVCYTLLCYGAVIGLVSGMVNYFGPVKAMLIAIGTMSAVGLCVAAFLKWVKE